MFVTNCISTTKIQKISEITNFFRHYFLSRTEVSLINDFFYIHILFLLYLVCKIIKFHTKTKVNGCFFANAKSVFVKCKKLLVFFCLLLHPNLKL